jgi:hypothetical protein
MSGRIRELDVVALLRDHVDIGLVRGQVGTVVDALDGEHFEVEFCDDEGRTYAMASLAASELIVLHYAPVAA